MLFPLYDLNPTKRLPVLTVLLILVNLGIAWRVEQLPVNERIDVYYEYGAVPQRLSAIGSGKPVTIEAPVYGRRGGEWVEAGRRKIELSTDYLSVYKTLVTMMFLHGGWFHVGLNMWMLWLFGNNIEDRLGHFIFVGYYLIGGILAMALQWATNSEGAQPVIGASGALWAALGGYAVTWPWAKVKSLLFIGFPLFIDVPALVVIGIFFALDLFAGIDQLMVGAQADSVARWAHLGGCFAGVGMMMLLSIGAEPADGDWRGDADELVIAR